MQEPHEKPHLAVVLARAAAYDETAVTAARRLLETLDLPLATGSRVLVKPNLLRADMLTCTNAVIVAEACRWLRDKGCRVTVGDSPGFGTAKSIARHIGLDAALEKAGCGDIPILSLDSPVKRPLSFGGRIALSRHALEADHILNVPKLKAHTQMRMTGAVKNLFGCISGVRKAVMHLRHGDKEQDGVELFPALVADILGHLPPVATLMDGIEAMHVRGPSGGKPFPAHFLAASASPVALDTTVCSMLGVAPEDVPLWRELQRRNAPGAFPGEIVTYGEAAGEFDLSGFVLPESLNSQVFSPARLAVSTARRLWAWHVTHKA